MYINIKFPNSKNTIHFIIRFSKIRVSEIKLIFKKNTFARAKKFGVFNNLNVSSTHFKSSALDLLKA